MHERADILPCLNCEGAALAVEVHGLGWRVICPDCKAKTRSFEKEDEAVDAWNGGPLHRETVDRLLAQI